MTTLITAAKETKLSPISTYFNVRDWRRNSNTEARLSGKLYRGDKLLGNLRLFFDALQVFFHVDHEKVLNRGCFPQWKQEKTGSQVM